MHTWDSVLSVVSVDAMDKGTTVPGDRTEKKRANGGGEEQRERVKKKKKEKKEE